MKGFFTSSQVQSTSRPDGKLHTCVRCGKFRHAENPKVKPIGKFRKQIMIIGDCRTAAEDHTGRPWSGSGGRLLRKVLERHGVDLDEDCLSYYCVLCRVVDEKGNDREPNAEDVAGCRRSVLRTVQEHMPRLIILAGPWAVESLIGYRWGGQPGIETWRGWVIPDQDLKCWVAPVYHPESIGKDDRARELIFDQDLERALRRAEKEWPRLKRPKIEVIEDLEPLSRIRSGLVAFDYETTGIKPHAPGHRVVCAAVATGEDHCYAFMMPGTKKEREPWLRFLADPTVGKMAHNMKFEENWSAVRLRQPVAGWEWDSMLAAHILDNRSRVTGLKFQTYVRLGVVDYASEISPWLKSGTNDGNAMNKILELVETKKGREALLEYCALDAVYEYRIAMQQIDEIGYDFLPF